MRIPNFRYIVAAMLLLATMINYADRLALSVVAKDLRTEFGMNEQDYGWVVFWFMFAYAIMYAGSGPICDRLGTRKGFAVFITAWSLAAIGHATAVGKTSLSAWRFLLGLGEPGNFPAAAKAVAEWFPVEQRALGIGLFNAGSSLGSALAPPVVSYLTLQFGWRTAFVAVGALGFVWLAFWLLLYQPPHLSKWITEREWNFLKGRVRPPEEAVAVKQPKGEWLRVLKMRECFTLIVARFFTDPVVYFVIFWLPEYLRKERGFDLAMVGKYAWVPFVFGDIGYVLGGWFSGFLIRRGWKWMPSRFVVLAAGSVVMPIAIAAPRVPEAWMAIGVICVVTFGHALWISNLLTLPTDLFPATRVGTATGLSGMGGAIGGMIANLGTGYLVQNYSYTPVFLIAGCMHPLAFSIIYFSLYRKRRNAAAL
ncbi:MAG: MFS transporter [Acidobacteria bacterium]|nr:MFS transporter [Acidobacteriota bacterium]